MTTPTPEVLEAVARAVQAESQKDPTNYPAMAQAAITAYTEATKPNDVRKEIGQEIRGYCVDNLCGEHVWDGNSFIEWAALNEYLCVEFLGLAEPTLEPRPGQEGE